ncbi:glycosyltransferase [Nocardioides sp. KC13]|uniref:Glycosyltransferase n=1 Tax=Nocardioides turkmenicus TaxID=2711220 RepID=A0A6M1QVY1_9ACTN|nr:glycosyltransferase [Nocardioides sp. KC13]NGN92024.1 glycosyltransferase [Nocardioides sp. KC13]
MRVVRSAEDFNGGQREPLFPQVSVAAIVPCRNEEAAVGDVVRGLLEAVPGIEVYVYDNASSDDTVAVARAAGANVRCEPRPGKGNVVRRAFADIDADVYLMIDGDDTYDVSAAPKMIRTLLEGPYDHVLGTRLPETAESAYRPGHRLGNQVINHVVAWLFGEHMTDMLSGYRVMSRRFVKSFPASSYGFEIETELTVRCLTLRVPCAVVQVGFRDRPEGSESKLNTFRDGFRIMSTVLRLFRYERPGRFYPAIVQLGLLMIGAPWVASLLLPFEFPGFLGVAALVALCLVVTVSMINDAHTRARHDSAHLIYMQHPAPLHLEANPIGKLVARALPIDALDEEPADSVIS